MEPEKFEMWCRVDLFGHNQRVGKLSVVNTGVEVLSRLAVPQRDGSTTTEFYAKGAVYSILPVSEGVARLIALKISAEPISQWDLPEQWREAIRSAQEKALPAHVTSEQIAAQTERDREREDDDFDADEDDFDADEE